MDLSWNGLDQTITSSRIPDCTRLKIYNLPFFYWKTKHYCIVITYNLLMLVSGVSLLKSPSHQKTRRRDKENAKPCGALWWYFLSKLNERHGSIFLYAKRSDSLKKHGTVSSITEKSITCNINYAIFLTIGCLKPSQPGKTAKKTSNYS